MSCAGIRESPPTIEVWEAEPVVKGNGCYYSISSQDCPIATL